MDIDKSLNVVILNLIRNLYRRIWWWPGQIATQTLKMLKLKTLEGRDA